MIEQDLHKVCPECAGEYRPDVEQCADCEVPLMFPEEIAARDARELRLSPWLIMLRTAPIAWVRALASDLDKQGIPYRIDRRRAREDGLLTACPACGRPHMHGVRECSGCGLVLGAGPGIDQTCSRCGAVIGVSVLHCPNCAAEMPLI